MAGLPYFIKTLKNRSFAYRPRYYDEDKQRLEDLKEAADPDRERSPGSFKPAFRKASIHDAHHGVVQRDIRRSNITLIVLIFTLLLMGYVIWIMAIPFLENV